MHLSDFLSLIQSLSLSLSLLSLFIYFISISLLVLLTFISVQIGKFNVQKKNSRWKKGVKVLCAQVSVFFQPNWMKTNLYIGYLLVHDTILGFTTKEIGRTQRMLEQIMGGIVWVMINSLNRFFNLFSIFLVFRFLWLRERERLCV